MKKTLLFLLLLALLSACVSTKIESNKIEGFSKEVRRIYIRLNTSKESTELLTAIASEMKPMLAKHKIEAQTGKVRDLDLGDEAARVEEQIAYYQPDLILTLQLTSKDENWGYYGPGYGTYYSELNKLSATLGNFPQDKPVWKAILRSRASLPGLGGSNIAKKIVRRMEADGMIAPESK